MPLPLKPKGSSRRRNLPSFFSGSGAPISWSNSNEDDKPPPRKRTRADYDAFLPIANPWVRRAKSIAASTASSDPTSTQGDKVDEEAKRRQGRVEVEAGDNEDKAELGGKRKGKHVAPFNGEERGSFSDQIPQEKSHRSNPLSPSSSPQVPKLNDFQVRFEAYWDELFGGGDPSLDFVDEYIARQFGKAGPSGVGSAPAQGTTPIGLAGKEGSEGDGAIGKEMEKGGGSDEDKQVQAEKTDEKVEEEGSKAEGGESGGSKDGTSPAQVSAGNEAEVAEEEYSIEVVVTLRIHR